jgi:hypothetical protein
VSLNQKNRWIDDETDEERAESLRLPSKVRLKFELRLGEAKDAKGFKSYFEKSLERYSRIIDKAFTLVFNEDEVHDWFKRHKIDIVTWHYKTRHSSDEDEDSGRWLSGQVIFADLKKDPNLAPFPRTKSPYIGIYGNELGREEREMGGPICILLPKEGESDEWGDTAVQVPPDVAEILRKFPEHQGDKGPLTQKHLELVRKTSPAFITELAKWMKKARGQKTEDLESLNHLLASLKVTLKLYKDHGCEPPRSTFLCPAYVAGEEVGGMAFACAGIFKKRTAFLGEGISTSLLTYLRLREDALAHYIAEEKEKIDQAKRFLINRFVHDFRHPVESLQSAVKEAKSSLTSIEKQLSNVNRVMNETIVAFEGRNPKELLRARKRPDKVAEFFADIRFFFKSRFEAAGKNLMICPDPIPPHWSFDIDRGMFHEVLENLIANALEHGGPNIMVQVEKQNGKYDIHVKDDGDGISVKDQDGLFKAFYKKPTRIKDGRIRGRGLIISRMLVEAHHGTLQVRPGDHKWKTDFIIEIPTKNGTRGTMS